MFEMFISFPLWLLQPKTMLSHTWVHQYHPYDTPNKHRQVIKNNYKPHCARGQPNLQQNLGCRSLMAPLGGVGHQAQPATSSQERHHWPLWQWRAVLGKGKSSVSIISVSNVVLLQNQFQWRSWPWHGWNTISYICFASTMSHPPRFKTASWITQFLQIKLWLQLSQEEKKQSTNEEAYSGFPVGQCPTPNELLSCLRPSYRGTSHILCCKEAPDGTYQNMEHGCIPQSQLPAADKACSPKVSNENPNAQAYPFRGPPSLTTLRWASCLFRWSL